MEEKICCPRFENSEEWQNKVFNWDGKNFIKEKVLTFFYVPVNFGKKISRLIDLSQKQNAGNPDQLCLCDNTSKWNMDIYLATDKDVEGAENVKLSGKFLSRVYEGPFKDTGKWCDDFKEYAEKENYNILKWYMWYTTCPKCAKKYGKNYTVIIAQISEKV